MATPNAAVTTKRKPLKAHAEVEQTAGLPNKIVKWMLRSPLHGLISPWLMLVSYTGHKSGKTFTTPVSYVKQEKGVVFFTNHNWWHNFEARSPVMLRIKGHDLHWLAMAVIDPYEIEPVVRAYLEEKGVRSAWLIAVRLKAKEIPDRDGLARAIAEGHTVMVRAYPARYTRIESFDTRS